MESELPKIFVNTGYPLQRWLPFDAQHALAAIAPPQVELHVSRQAKFMIGHASGSETTSSFAEFSSSGKSHCTQHAPQRQSWFSALSPIKLAHCQQRQQLASSTSSGSSQHFSDTFHSNRANTEQLRAVFKKYASVQTQTGESLMTRDDFARRFLQMFQADETNPETVDLIGSVADTNKNGYISFPEFQAFEAVLCQPDAIYLTAFNIFDTTGVGSVTFEDFQTIVQHTLLHRLAPFDFEGEFIQMHFGRARKRPVSYQEFTEILHDFHEAYAQVAFKKFDRDQNGFIRATDFYAIMTTLRPHLLSDFVRDNLIIAASSTKKSKVVSFPYFMAFNWLLNNM